jgi:hypothetical protein
MANQFRIAESGVELTRTRAPKAVAKATRAASARGTYL